jgi:hypothetical protein
MIETETVTLYTPAMSPSSPVLMTTQTVTHISTEVDAPAPTPAATHTLPSKWDMYYHLPQNTSWDISSYKKLFSGISIVEEVISITDVIPDTIVKTCMLFVMRDGIKPLWEDPKNRNGGCFSFKILNRVVYDVWKNIFYALAGGTLFKDRALDKYLNGITISPKKNFCILKIWMVNMDYQNPEIIIDINGLVKTGCIFRGHTPEW